MSRRYLVTGGTGFIGSAIVRRLVKDGHRVVCLDNDFRGHQSSLADLGTKIELRQGDIRDAAAVRSAAAGVDSVIHLAFVNGTKFFYSMPELVLDVAVRGMTNVIDACRANGVKELVLASSSEVYQTPPRVPTDETAPLSVPDPLNPRYSYGGGKIISELMALNYGRTGFDRVLIFRPHNVYGPQMGWEHVLPELTLRARELAKSHPAGKLRLQIQGDGKQTRAFVHIDDLVDGVMCVLERGEHLNIYHIGNPEEVTIGDAARKIVKLLGREVELETSDAPAGGTARRVPDIAKIARLGFKPRIPFDKGLETLVSWYVANAHLRPDVKGAR